ncbi:hypothetical protein I3760_15G155300 [Carya illinoinensis]|nr:hypothetical protein I3760_15G155300 [Carya illinoinensis]
MGAEELASYGAGYEMDNDDNFSDSEVVYHVKDALNSVSLGDSDSYDQLVGVMHHNERLAPEEVALLVTSLKALSGAVSYIDVVLHDSLLTSIFRMNMWNYRPDVMDALLELIISLAASNGKHVNSCLEMLVSNFTPPYSFVDTLTQPRGLAKKEQVLSRVHSALKHIADLVPLAPSILSPIVSQRMPIYAKEPLAVIYLENVDEIADYDEEDDYELPRELSRKSLGGNLIAEKLDSLMALTFEHLESCKANGRLNEVFEPLLDSFRITVLTTYKSKFAQFVMFYVCALDPENCGVRFATMLADIFVSKDYPMPFRMSAVAYLASFLSRANFLSSPFVAIMLKRLVDWCLEYCKTEGGEINPVSHRLFYSACQAIMYVLCFRMKSMMDVAWFKSHLLFIEPILKHALSPLKVCLPSIVDEFCQQAEAANLFSSSEEFAFSDSLESEHSKAFGGMERLDMFFPFDPCLLRKSDRFIRPYFVYWSMVRPPCDEAEGISDEDIGEQEIDLDVSKMSITPRKYSAYWIQDGFEEPRGMPARIRPSTSPESL